MAAGDLPQSSLVMVTRLPLAASAANVSLQLRLFAAQNRLKVLAREGTRLGFFGQKILDLIDWLANRKK
jgi:hypothetical protein